ncbi:MAG: extracellular solute-binding protein [Clostridia bacterium]|nr:extracellular solute-binding protein [Clostridia bacterium]
MAKKMTKIASLMLASTILCTSAFVMAGCKKSDTDNRETISADQSWFNCKKVKLECPYSADEVTQISIDSPVVIDDNIYALITGEKSFDVNAAFKDPNFNYNDYIINSIAKYDMEGKFIEEIVIENTTNLDLIQATTLSVQDGKLKAMCLGGNANSGSASNMFVLVDPKTGASEIKEFNLEVGDLGYAQDTLNVGDYTLAIIADFTEDSVRYKIAIVQDDKTISTVDLSQQTNKQVEYISNTIPVDEETLIIDCYGEGKSFTLELDIPTGKAKVTDMELDTDDYYFNMAQDGVSYAIDYSGIFAIGEDLKPEMIMDFNDTNVNVSSIWGGKVVYSDGDKIIAFQNDYASLIAPDSYIYLFDKADTNPNAGKKILNVYSLNGGISYSEAEAIVQFNNNNADYFAKIEVDDTDYDDSDDSETAGLKTANEISDKLVMDLMAGEGPDVILNAQGNKQLENAEYFVDLTPLINGNDGIDMSKYVSNIIDGSKTPDGEMFFIPLAYGIEGIMIQKTDMKDGQIGFTYDNFPKFVDEVCNGSSPIVDSQIMFIVDGISTGSVPYLKDGKVDFNNDEFKSLCDFAKDNISPEVSSNDYDDIYTIGFDGTTSTDPKYVEIFSPLQFISEARNFKDAVTIYGMPSSKENGPSAYVYSSASISANCDDAAKKASWDFIKTMLDPEVQKYEEGAMPVSKDALDYLAKDAVDTMNEEYDMMINLGMDEQTLVMYGMTRLDYDVADDLISAVNNVGSVYSTDMAIAPILEEELGGYLAGQKSFDEVVKVINDRTQTVINERGNN